MPATRIGRVRGIMPVNGFSVPCGVSSVMRVADVDARASSRGPGPAKCRRGSSSLAGFRSVRLSRRRSIFSMLGDGRLELGIDALEADERIGAWR